MIRRPPRSTLFPTRRSSDLRAGHHRRQRRAATRRRGDLAAGGRATLLCPQAQERDRKSTRLNSSHLVISYAVFCLKKKKKKPKTLAAQTHPSIERQSSPHAS